MSEEMISVQETIQGDAAPMDTPLPETPMETPAKVKNGKGKGKTTQANKPTKPALTKEQKAAIKAEKQAAQEKLAQERAKQAELAKQWESIRLDLSDAPLRGHTLTAYNSLVALITSGSIVIPGMDFSSAEKSIQEELETLTAKMKNPGTSIDEIIALSGRVTQLNASRGNASEKLAQAWAKSFVFSAFYGNSITSPTPTNSSGGVPNNNPPNNNIARVAYSKQNLDLFVAWAKNKGLPQNGFPVIVSNQMLTQEMWEKLGASDYFTSDGFQLFIKQGNSQYTYMAPLGTAKSESAVMTRYRQLITGLQSPPNNGIHSTTYGNGSNTFKDFNLNMAMDEFKNWAEKKVG